MRILVISPHLPWPLSAGGSAAQFSTLKCLSQDHSFTVIVPINSPEQERALAAVASELPTVKWRGAICYRESGGLKGRLSAFANDQFRKLRHRLRAKRHQRLATYPYDPFGNRISPELIELVSEELKRGYDICQVEFAEMLSLGSWLPKSLPRLFIHHQVHFVYSERFLSAAGSNVYGEYLSAAMRTQETAYLETFSGIVTFSEVDKTIVSTQIKNENIWVSPFPVPSDISFCHEVSDHFDGRFLFLAAETNKPNVDSLNWLLDEIWPRIVTALPASTLIVVGEWSKISVQRLTQPGVSFTGFVRDLQGTLSGGILLVPLRIGSGIRTKILVALAGGIPVISTPVGAEGLLVEDGRELVIRDGAVPFADGAIAIAHDPELRRTICTNGRETVKRHYSSEAVRKRRNQIYSQFTSSFGSFAEDKD
jgi:glycosyltransferase involved in cell wall biosynthesis